MSEERVITIYNGHCEDCGAPPNLDSRNFRYVAAFQNVHGEQMLFLQEPAPSLQTYVLMGDCEWDNRLRVIAGIVPGITMNQEEQKFVMAAWDAATRKGQKHNDGDLHDRCTALFTIPPVVEQTGLSNEEVLRRTVMGGAYTAARMGLDMSDENWPSQQLIAFLREIGHDVKELEKIVIDKAKKKGKKDK